MQQAYVCICHFSLPSGPQKERLSSLRGKAFLLLLLPHHVTLSLVFSPSSWNFSNARSPCTFASDLPIALSLGSLAFSNQLTLLTNGQRCWPFPPSWNSLLSASVTRPAQFSLPVSLTTPGSFLHSFSSSHSLEVEIFQCALKSLEHVPREKQQQGCLLTNLLGPLQNQKDTTGSPWHGTRGLLVL